MYIFLGEEHNYKLTLLKNIQLGPRGWAGLKADPDLPSSKGALAPAQEIQPTVYHVPNWYDFLLYLFSTTALQ